jgi:hypothetical protein
MWRLLLLHRDRLLVRVLADAPLAPTLWRLVAVMIVSAAVYGATLGFWHGARLALYDAVKLPLVLVLTSLVTMFFSWIIALAYNVPLRFGQVAVLTFVALATASLVLVSLAPIAWFFTLCAPPPSAAARTTHNALYLMHTSFVGACGIAGTRVLWDAMRRVRQPRRLVAPVYVLWVLAYAVVGGEVAWALRPFVGSVSPQYPVVFLRRDALAGNVYEFIGTDIVPYLWSSTPDAQQRSDVRSH